MAKKVEPLVTARESIKKESVGGTGNGEVARATKVPPIADLMFSAVQCMCEERGERGGSSVCLQRKEYRMLEASEGRNREVKTGESGCVRVRGNEQERSVTCPRLA